MTIVIELDRLAEVAFAKVLHCKVTLTFPYCAFFEEINCLQLTLKKWGVMLLLWGQIIYINYLEFLPIENLPLLPHLLICLIITYIFVGS